MLPDSILIVLPLLLHWPSIQACGLLRFAVRAALFFRGLALMAWGTYRLKVGIGFRSGPVPPELGRLGLTHDVVHFLGHLHPAVLEARLAQPIIPSQHPLAGLVPFRTVAAILPTFS